VRRLPEGGAGSVLAIVDCCVNNWKLAWGRGRGNRSGRSDESNQNCKVGRKKGSSACFWTIEDKEEVEVGYNRVDC
jgi:hypothetical protein